MTFGRVDDSIVKAVLSTPTSGHQKRSSDLHHGGRRFWRALKGLLLIASHSTVAIALSLILFSPVNVLAQKAASTNRLEQAATLIRDNRIEEAERQLSLVLKVSANDAVALNLLGTIRAKQGRLNEAEALFSRAVRSDKQLAGAHMNLAYLYLLKGMPDKTALELKEVLRLDPTNSDAIYRLAWVMLSQGRYDECISVIDQAKQPGRASAPLLALLGDAYLKKEDVDKAEGSYLLALGEQGDNADALLGLAQVCQSRGDFKAAAVYLSRAKSVITESPDLLYKFALVALNSQLESEAILALKRAIELRIDDPSYYLVLGATWLKKPDVQEAEVAFRQSLKLRPDNAQGQMYLGYTLLKQKKYPEAREWLEKSIRKDSSTPETFYYLGLIAQEQGEDQRAVEQFQKALQLSPSFSHAHIAAGATYLKMKDYPRAQQELEAGVKLNPNDSKAHYNLALLYTRLKDPKRAQEEMQILERLKNSNGQTKENDILTPSSPRPR
jgi:tetratricopeptide (TPR) repeat protein